MSAEGQKHAAELAKLEQQQQHIKQQQNQSQQARQRNLEQQASIKQSLLL